MKRNAINYIPTQSLPSIFREGKVSGALQCSYNDGIAVFRAHTILSQYDTMALKIAGDSIVPTAHIASTKWKLKQGLCEYLQTDLSLSRS